MSESCSIYRFDCNDEEIPPNLQYLISIAKQQKIAFKDIFPWEDYSCSSDIVSYVAFDPGNQVICGWIKIIVFPEDKRIYISLLSSRSSTDPNYRGIGTKLINNIISDFRDYNFIYLQPTFKARSFYLHIGFKDYGSPYYLFKPIAKIETSDVQKLDNEYNYNLLIIALESEGLDRYVRKLERLIDKKELSINDIANIKTVDDIVLLLNTF